MAEPCHAPRGHQGGSGWRALSLTVASRLILQCLLFPQVEMFLLAYAVRHTIQVYRLSKYSTEEFITVYPTDPPRDWPVVTLIAEDDRHYNIPVRVCEETSL